MRSGACETGTQVMCNNNITGCATGSGPNQGAQIRPIVTAGQTYFIVVDGSSGASGNFTLRVTSP